MLLPADAFGPDAPEGSEAFRFEAIATKPAFILSQLDATNLPVVYMDVDLEFHQYPTLFNPGSWPDFDRLALGLGSGLRVREVVGVVVGVGLP